MIKTVDIDGKDVNLDKMFAGTSISIKWESGRGFISELRGDTPTAVANALASGISTFMQILSLMGAPDKEIKGTPRAIAKAAKIMYERDNFIEVSKGEQS